MAGAIDLRIVVTPQGHSGTSLPSVSADAVGGPAGAGWSSTSYGGSADIRVAQHYLGVPCVWGGASGGSDGIVAGDQFRRLGIDLGQDARVHVQGEGHGGVSQPA